MSVEKIQCIFSHQMEAIVLMMMFDVCSVCGGGGGGGVDGGEGRGYGSISQRNITKTSNSVIIVKLRRAVTKCNKV